MATTYTGFNETVLMKDSLGALKSGLISLNAFSTGISMTGKMYGETVLVPVRGAASATTRTLGAAGSAGGASSTKSVTLTSPISSQWEAVDGRDPITAFMDRAVEHSYAVAKAYLDAAFAYVTAANYGNTTADKLVVPQAEFGLTDITSLIGLAVAKKLGRNKALVLNGAYTFQALGEGQFALILATMGGDALKTGKLPPLGGAESFMYSELATNSENLVGFVCDPSCLACGMAPVMSLAGGAGKGNLEFEGVIGDPESGVVMSYRRWYDADAGKMSGRFEVMPGFAVCNNAVVRLVSA